MRATQRRSGFTLIELLVVTGLILVLATLTVAVVSRVRDEDVARQGADKMQGWLLMAKQWALRDQAPRGLRMTANAAGEVVDAQFIEQPDDFVGPAGSGILVSNVVDIPPAPTYLPGLFLTGPPTYWRPELQGGVVVIAYQGTIDFSGGWSSGGNMAKWPVQIGDLIEFGSGSKATTFRILDIQITQPSPGQIALVTGPPLNGAVIRPNLPKYVAGADFRIVRQVRPKAGELALQLPAKCVMSALSVNNYGGLIPAGPTAGVYDIVFDPAGSVRNATRPVQLWFADLSRDRPASSSATNPVYGGLQFIITINAQTGLISNNPLDATPSPTNPALYNDPFSFTRDGRTTGI